MSTRDWTSLIESATELRHELHRRPELTWQESDTAATIRAELDRLKIPWRVCAEHGTVATLGGKGTGTNIALRADIDALPIFEESGVDWTSQTVGKMHACGHDGHTATLISAAAWLKAHETDLPGSVTLLFQPAEEGGHGAKRMIEDGALEGVDAVFGWHNWPAIPFGKAVCPNGTVMAGNGTFHIEVLGEGGHASQPEACRDPVPAAAAIALALQRIVSRRRAPQQAGVVSLTTIRAGKTDTIIPAQVKMSGSIRFAEIGMRDEINDAITQTVEQTARAWGVEARVEHERRYLPTMNSEPEAERYRELLSAELGEDWHSDQTAMPIMASEDFSYYLQERPGAFALIGAGRPEAANYPCHSPRYDFNDELIPVVARLFLRLAGAPLP